MSDNFKGALSQVAEGVKEAVAKPVIDEVGKAIEEGVQSVTGSQKPLDPIAQQKKLEEEQKRKQWAIHVIKWNETLQQNQQQVRQQKQQEEQTKKEEEKKEEQVKQYKAIEKKQQESIALKQTQTRTETKGGVGG